MQQMRIQGSYFDSGKTEEEGDTTMLKMLSMLIGSRNNQPSVLTL